MQGHISLASMRGGSISLASKGMGILASLASVGDILASLASRCPCHGHASEANDAHGHASEANDAHAHASEANDAHAHAHAMLASPSMSMPRYQCQHAHASKANNAHANARRPNTPKLAMPTCLYASKANNAHAHARARKFIKKNDTRFSSSVNWKTFKKACFIKDKILRHFYFFCQNLGFSPKTVGYSTWVFGQNHIFSLSHQNLPTLKS